MKPNLPAIRNGIHRLQIIVMIRYPSVRNLILTLAMHDSMRLLISSRGDDVGESRWRR